MATTRLLKIHTSNENESKFREWYVIALSGVSSGGKTAIATKLLNGIPGNAVYISQDQYIRANDYPGHLKAPKPLNGYNKDSLHSIDMAKMIIDIRYVLMNDPADIDIDSSPLSQDRKKVIGSALGSPRPPFHGYKRNAVIPPVLILDGFLLFNHPDIPPLCNAKYFITLTKEQCWERRKNRVFTAPGMDAQSYFEHCMWPKYEEHFQKMCNTVKDIHYINGLNPLEETSQSIFEDLMKNLAIDIKTGN